MGTGNSKENWRQSSFRSASASSASASPSSSSWASQQSYPQYGADSYNYPPQPSYAPSPPEYTQPPSPLYNTQPYSAPPSQSYGSDNKKRLERKYSRISDDYSSLEQVTEALARAGLESSNLIVGMDFTKSNEWTGARSFNRKSLHFIGSSPNPYEQAITIIGRTLAAFDEDNLIPCYGFGDASTHDQDVFSFNSEDRFCNGFEEVLARYKEIVPQLKLAGPTSFAPIIDMAMTIVEQSGGQYHVLVIIADGQVQINSSMNHCFCVKRRNLIIPFQVTRSVDTENGQLSPQEQKTVDAIVQASKLPLSIVLVGVGDGPWDMMREFDDNIPSRAFDNFQVSFFLENDIKLWCFELTFCF
ncbi:hypothetical protein CARUB_v10000894mg [Capsella rubella]|uniref:RING-type E3 ubiquitin transferase n=1 Tax=Capsella rubella TaxID=81985 RepID=R0HAF7_9BRAS|nr:hypothetical protein CARUB_v10000894mg [Capsella rubella]EOA20584.1 hypothetical protein CARUB_v10000894mg [Capsella rubella]